MSYGYDEFESKLGQFIYTMVMYERLREYLLEKLRGKDRLSVRINLGADKAGNQVVMDVVLTAVKPQLFSQQAEVQKRRSKKTLAMILTNEDVDGENHQIESEMEKLVLESLKWWHGYFGERDKLKLDSWKCERAEVLAGDYVGSVVELPVSRILVPPGLLINVSEVEREVLAQYVDLFTPVAVRPAESEMYELLGGVRVFDVMVNKLGYDRVKALVLHLDEQQAASVRAEIEEKTGKLVKSLLSM
ncbi:MAG: hypothetical protein QXV68_05055 [Candidatus Caldarchaeum sp.]